MAMPRKWPRGYYTYVWRFPDGTPYYVGAGKESRCNPINRKLDGRFIDRELREEGKVTLVEIIPASSAEEAFKLETELIERFGRQCNRTGPLYNITTGRGARGMTISQERRDICSRTAKNRVVTDEFREQCRIRMLGNKNLLGHTHSEESRRLISEKGKGRVKKKESIEKMLKTRTLNGYSEETRRKLSIAGKSRKVNAYYPRKKREPSPSECDELST